MNKEISVTYMSGPEDGRTLQFVQPVPGEERIVVFGRREGCDVYMPFDSQVSRIHARLICRAEQVSSSDSVQNPFALSFWLEDSNSRNGTFVEKQSDPIKGRVNLRPGTLFRVGRTWMRLDIPLS